MVILLNWETLEPALPDMSMALVVLVVSPNVTRHPPLHERTERRFSRRLDN
jgi:hypothetical protein